MPWKCPDNRDRLREIDEKTRRHGDKETKRPTGQRARTIRTERQKDRITSTSPQMGSVAVGGLGRGGVSFCVICANT